MKPGLAYKAGKLWGTAPLPLLLVVIVGSVSLLTLCSRPAQVSDADVKEAVAKTQSAKYEAERKACVEGRAALIAEHSALMTAGRHWQAARALEQCRTLLREDAELGLLFAKAEQQAHIAAAKDASNTLEERDRHISKLFNDHPDAAKGYEKLRDDIARRLIAAKKKAEADRRAERRKEGVSIGMSAQDVVESSWGKPSHINRSTYSWGVREQWVYDGGYLYFKDGVLDSIQTRH